METEAGEKLTHCLISSNALNEKGVDCWQLTWHRESPISHFSFSAHKFTSVKIPLTISPVAQGKLFVGAKIFALVRENWNKMCLFIISLDTWNEKPQRFSQVSKSWTVVGNWLGKKLRLLSFSNFNLAWSLRSYASRYWNNFTLSEKCLADHLITCVYNSGYIYVILQTLLFKYLSIFITFSINHYFNIFLDTYVFISIK